LAEYSACIKDVEIFVEIGIHDHEKGEAQRLLVSVEMKSEFTTMRMLRHLEHGIDYEPVLCFILSWQKQAHVELIEELLEDLMDFCFSNVLVSEVIASIQKSPKALVEKGEVGVTLKVNREEWAQCKARL